MQAYAAFGSMLDAIEKLPDVELSVKSYCDQEGSIVTQEEQARMQALEEKLACLESIIEHVSEGVILTDQDCRIVEFNPAKERMEHMRASDVLGMVSWEAYTHSNREISEHQQVSDTGKPILNAYRPHAYVGDIPVYIYYSTYPVIRNGKVIGVYTISRNEEILRELLYETIEEKRGARTAEDPPVAEIRKADGTSYTFSDFVGKSPKTRELLREAQTVAATDGSILIIGETGTGKEVLAQSIHNFGRENRRFVAVNCAAIPENLLESTLFGSVRGAFTGAMDRQGLFSAAGDGTLFLDEINSMSVAMQAKLLRALQEKCIRPVGSLKEEPIRCRLICASNETVETLLQENRMRRDLFYRISDFVLTIPPLRERHEDILDLSEMFIRRYNWEFRKNISGISPALRSRLLNGDWNGNTRELEHVIRNLMLRISELDTELTEDGYPAYLPRKTKDAPFTSMQISVPLPEALRRFQRELILRALEQHQWNLSQTALSLGIQRQNLTQRMLRLGIAAE